MTNDPHQLRHSAIKRALDLLRQARDMMRMANAPLDAVNIAVKSAENAERRFRLKLENENAG